MYFVFIHGYCRDETFFEEFGTATKAAEYIKTRMKYGDKSSKYIVVEGDRVGVRYNHALDDVFFEKGK